MLKPNELHALKSQLEALGREIGVALSSSSEKLDEESLYEWLDSTEYTDGLSGALQQAIFAGAGL